MPKISVIMSVHNGERHLAESIESILGQSFTDFELIIVDDCSNDKTSDILKGYSYKDPRVKIIMNEKNLGLTISLNIGIKSSKGEYIARMDAGDTSEKKRFEKQVRFLYENQDHVLVGSFAHTFDDDSRIVGEMKYGTDDKTLKKTLIKINPLVHSSIMMRRRAFEQAGGYNEEWRYCQDYELYFRLARLGKFANLPEYLVSYRMTPNSITRRKNKKQVSFAIKARTKAIKEGQYPFWAYFYLLRPTIGLVLPYKLKYILKKHETSLHHN